MTGSLPIDERHSGDVSWVKDYQMVMPPGNKREVTFMSDAFRWPDNAGNHKPAAHAGWKRKLGSPDRQPPK
jgi:hypothetical protein